MTQVRLAGAATAAVTATTRYDADGNAVSTTDPTTLYAYDAAGNLILESDPNGMTTTYQYDDLNRLMLETVKENGVLVETFDYNQVLLGEAGKSQDPSLMLQSDGDRGGDVDTRYNADGTIASQITYAWTYDQDDRLISEQLTINAGEGQTGVPTPYLDVFTYDLSNNRMSETISGGDNQNVADTITYTYNSDDQLIDEKEVDAAGNTIYQTTYTYDANGNLSTQTRTGSGAESDTYSYDLWNRMTKVVTNGTETDYGYDTNGVRTSEGSPGGTQTYYLNDPNNPTGETKAIEEATGPSQSNAAISRSYVLGLKVEAQQDATGNQYASDGTVYLLTDGHGSTRALMNSSGQTVETYVYDAFGTLLAGAHTNTATNTTTAITAADTETEWLFGGDGLYDPSSGWTYHLARWTNGFWFTQSDFGAEGQGNNNDPITLHKYLYANADPVNNSDPSGHDSEAEELTVASIMSNLVDLVSTVSSAYQKARSVYNAVRTISGILQLATGDMSDLISSIEAQIGSLKTSFGRYSSIFSADGVAAATEDLLENAFEVGEVIASNPEKLEELTAAYEGPNPALVIKMPTPPLANPLAALPPIPTGIRLGSSGLPVYLSFETATQTGRFIGLAIASDCTTSRFDTRVAEVFHMDYVIHAANLPFEQQQMGNWGVWTSGDGKFEFQVPKV